MAVNKIIKSDGSVLLDLTEDTVTTADHIKLGRTAHLANGTIVTGTGFFEGSGVNLTSAEKQYLISLLNSEESEKVHLSELDYTETFTLSATSYPSWTPTTSQTTIRSPQNAFSHVGNVELYDYEYLWTFVFNPVYSQSAVKKNMIIKHCSALYQYVTKRPRNTAEIISREYTTAQAAAITAFGACVYYNTNGSETIGVSGYGAYFGNPTASISNVYIAEPTITINTPSIYSRTNATYFSVDSANSIIQNQSTITIKCKTYRTKKPSFANALYSIAFDLHNE